MSSQPAQRRRVVGLPNPLPRGARQLSNDEEMQRRAAERAMDVQSDLTSSIEDDFDDHDQAQGYVSPQFNPHSPSPPPQNRQPPDEAVVAPIQRPTAPRNRYYWTGNNAKLNMLASAYINQPM